MKRWGGSRTYHSKCRIIAATNKDLEGLIDDGLFREDLYYRLNMVNIMIPPLRHRPEDIPVFVDLFIKQANQRFNKNVKGLVPELKKFVETHDWPGNIRQLKNTVSYAVLLSDSNYIRSLDKFSGEVQEEPLEFHRDLKTTMAEICARYESEIISRIMKENGNNVSRAAEVLGISRKTLYQKINQYNIKM